MTLRAALCAGAFCLLASCIKGVPVRDANSIAGPLPFAAIRAAPKEGRDQIMLLAGFSGRFDIDSECVLVKMDGGADPLMPFFYDGTRIGRDSAGFYLRDGKTGSIFRDGDTFTGGGGFVSIEVFEARYNTRVNVPQICRDRSSKETVLSINPGFLPTEADRD